jgi:hypothetical protein
LGNINYTEMFTTSYKGYKHWTSVFEEKKGVNIFHIHFTFCEHEISISFSSIRDSVHSASTNTVFK